MDDLLKLQLEPIQFTLEPIGLNFREKNICINPHHINRNYSKPSILESKLLLLDYKNIHEDVIYLVTLDDLESSVSDEVDKVTLKKMYYPSYYKDETIYQPDYEKAIESIEKQHKLYETNKLFNDYKINELFIELTPKNDIYIPIQDLFKIIQTNSMNSMIQLNIDKDQDKILRLYAPEQSLNYSHIPFLTKKKIKQYSDKNTKLQTIHFYRTFLNFFFLFLPKIRVGQGKKNKKNKIFFFYFFQTDFQKIGSVG